MLHRFKLNLEKHYLTIAKYTALFFLVLYGVQAFAEDILAGTTTNLVDTLNTTGKTYLYLAEGIISLAAYIKTKNLLFLAGIVVVSVFFNIMLSVAGVAS